MTIDQALEFIHSVKWRGSKPGLSRTRELMNRLGNPEKSCRFIHVAGTNGKGSTCAMLASVLSHAGYRTGLYTSPYIFRFNERMMINGSAISDDDICRLTELVRPIAESMEDRPTEFEIVTAIGMKYFAENECDFVVLEVGMGGRLDSTNVIDTPELAVITRIGLDHVGELGTTVEEIAFEKAGIIKPGGSVAVYAQEPGINDVFLNVCCQRGASLRFSEPEQIERLDSSHAGQSFRYKSGPEKDLPLLGTHQLCNAALVLEAVEALREKGHIISEDALREGLRSVVWPARFEIVSQRPAFVVDGGHNPQCAETVRANLLEYFPEKRRVLLVGVLADKDYAGLFAPLLSVADEFVTVTPDNPRALPAEALAEFLRGRDKPATACADIRLGVETALELAGDEGIVCAVGSLYIAGDVRAYFGLN